MLSVEQQSINLCNPMPVHVILDRGAMMCKNQLMIRMYMLLL